MSAGAAVEPDGQGARAMAVEAEAKRSRLPFGPELVLMLGRSLGFAVTFFIPVVLVRVFDQTTFGTYKQLFLIFSTVYFIAQAGMAESLFYFVPLARGRAGRYVANSVLSLGTLGLACAVLLTVAAPRLAAWMNNPGLRPNLPWVGLIVFLMLSAAGFEIALIARERYGWAATSYGVSDLVRSLLFILPALITGRLVAVLIGAALLGAVRVAAMLVCFAREFRGFFRPSGQAFGAQLAYAVPFGAAVVVEVLQGNLHQYVIAAKFDAATFAIYAVGCLQIPFVDFVAGPAGNVMMVQMSDSRARGDRAAVRELWHRTVTRLATVFVPLVVVLLVLARDLIVVLFTPAYAASVPIFMAWTAAILFSIFPTDAFLRVHAETRFILLVNLVRFALILGSIVWFLDTFGLMGAVLVTLLGVVVAKVMMLLRIKRLLRADLAGLLPWRSLSGIVALATLAALPAWAVNSALGAHPFAGLLLAGATYVAVYVAALAWNLMRPRGAGEPLEAVRLVGG